MNACSVPSHPCHLDTEERAMLELRKWLQVASLFEGVTPRLSLTLNADGTFELLLIAHGFPSDPPPIGEGYSASLAEAFEAARVDLVSALELASEGLSV